MRTGIKKHLLMGLTLILVGTTASAQQESKEERRAQLESKKVAYCTDRAGLTPEESAAFWALRNEVDQEKKAIMDEAPRKRDIDPENASDKELREAIKKNVEQRIKAAQLEYDHLDEFMDIVGPKKFAMLQKAEKEFKKEVLRNLKDRRNARDEERGRGPRAPRDPR
ncbi:MAG: hypothetical protein HKN79_10250 [Flavobacteriales bacterium]|nr:hypothetical protein [Flavobacteriales bacterium]